MINQTQIDQILAISMRALLITGMVVYFGITLIAWRRSENMHKQITTVTGTSLRLLNLINLVIAIILLIASLILSIMT